MQQRVASRIADTLSGAIAEAGALLASDTAAAESYLLELLKHAPGEPHALALLADAKRLQNDLEGGRTLLENLEAAEPNLAAIPFERGKVLHDMGDCDGAISAFSRTVQLEPFHPAAWRALGDLYVQAKRGVEAAAAYGKHAEAMRSELRMIDPAAHAADDPSPAVEHDLLAWLERHPTEVAARRMLGIRYMKQGRAEEGERQFSDAIRLSPNFSSVRWMLARSLTKRQQWEAAIPHLRLLLTHAPEDEDYLDLLAESLVSVGNTEEAILYLERLLTLNPSAENWLHYGHALRSVGRGEDCIVAYRKAIAARPEYGPAYWSLANLKTVRFEPHEVEHMQQALERPDQDRNSCAQMHFALGKAFEDAKQYALSFEHYEKGNAVWRRDLPAESRSITEWVRRWKALFTHEFYRRRAGAGCPAPDPIFIVGLPRSGTTLIEQILASHSMVAGAGELPVLGYVAEQIADYAHTGGANYPEILRERTADDFRAAGEAYIEWTRRYRKPGRQVFTDKMMSNFNQLGLILLILPNAKIIDARRHPLGTGFANFKQFYPVGQPFAFDMTDLGNYYRDYVALMAHFDSIVSGRVHRVFYERMVTETETEIRKLLDYCGLPFEDACLRFYEADRGVVTASSEQVRRPIFSQSLTQWQNYERWLGPLKTALGDVLTCYPDVPRFNEPAAAPLQPARSGPLRARFVSMGPDPLSR